MYFHVCFLFQMHAKLGVVKRNNCFTLVIANTVYKDDEPVKMNFSLYLDPEIKKSENNFHLAFVKQENEFAKTLPMIKEYIKLTDHAHVSHDQAQLLFNDRVSILHNMKPILSSLVKLLGESTKNTLISAALFMEHIQVTLAWGLNGVEGGPSGTEFLVFHVLDEFLGILGDCGIYHVNQRNRNAMPSVYRELLDSLKVGLDYRFNSFVGHMDSSNNPLIKAKHDLIKCIAMWRMMHAKRAKYFFSGSETTTSQNIEFCTDTKGRKIDDCIEEELRKRTKETMDCIKLDSKDTEKLHM